MSERRPVAASTRHAISRRERAYLTDAVMVLMKAMEQVPENDLSELPELQDLLELLMSDRELTISR